MIRMFFWGLLYRMFKIRSPKEYVRVAGTGMWSEMFEVF